MVSVPPTVGTYETVQIPDEPVEQSRSGLFPGLSGSFGSPAVNQNRTCVEMEVESAPSSS
jgi:hypothetical protein